MNIATRVSRLLLFAATCALAPALRPARADEVLVSAAASLTDAMTEIGAAYGRAHPRMTVRFNFGASGALQHQIELGAPVDVFASASPVEMDAIERSKRVVSSTRVTVAGNRLVLIAPPNSPLRDWDGLRSPSVRRVAISDPDSVPSGRYARETLAKRGLWSTVRPKAVFGENVRQTLTYVAGRNADAGLVFATDARIDADRVRVVATAVPGRDHDPILYPAAVVAGAPNPAAARSFVQFLRGPAAQAILARYGFTPAAALPLPVHVKPVRTPRRDPRRPGAR
jgi:molybdate transport system substrate-binding protein